VDFTDGEITIACQRATRSNMAYKDFVLEFDIRLVEDSGEPVQRFTLDYLDNNFVIDSSGRLGLSHGKTKFDIPRNISPFEKNRIWIIAKENRYAFYVNGEPVYYFEDNYYYSREPIQFSAEGLSVALDNLKIWDLEKTPNLP
jgi:hypothetical protein